MGSPGVTGLVSYWALGEPSGNALDSHGVNVLAETGGTIASAAGLNGNARDFELGDSEWFADDTVDASLKITDAITVNAWVKFESVGAVFHNIVNCNYDLSTAAGYRLGKQTTYVIDLYLNNGAAFASGTTVVTAGPWYMVTGSYNKDAGGTDEVKLYVNAGLEGTDDYSTAIGHGALTKIHIGANYAGDGGYFDGLMQHVSVWNRALSADEITWLYNAGAGRAYNDLLLRPTTQVIII